ncbi:MAG: nucleotide exchange factor GrpE [bacterium]
MSQGESLDQERSEAGENDSNVSVEDGPSDSNVPEQPETKEEYDQLVEHLRDERDEFKEKYLRKVADLDNLRKRHKEEKEKQRKYANKNLLKDLLEIVDNFDRALESMEIESSEVEDGIKMIRNQLGDLLSKHEVEKIDASGERFDPNYHEGMMQEERDDLDERTVLEVFQEGYVLHDQVLRPAQVKVGIPVQDDGNESTSDETSQ